MLLMSLSLSVSCKGNDPITPDPDPEPEPDPKEEVVFDIKSTPSPAEFTAAGGTLVLKVEHSMTYKVKSSDEWVKRVSTKAVTNDELKFEVEENKKLQAREATITLTPAEGDAKTITVKQEAGTRPQTIKILAIGNSFSADAVEQELYGLFAAAGQDVIIGDMYIGGCPLEKHAANSQSDAAAYSYRKIVKGTMNTTASVKLSEALVDEEWDYISVQEGAGYHGFYDTTYKGTTHSMEPALTTLIEYIKKTAKPGYTLVYHAPWAAQKGYTGTKFSYYGFDQQVMYQMICEATKQVCEKHPEIGLVMNSMDAVQNGRSSYLGDTFNRDGWHMSYTIGRYTVGCLWYEKIMGESVVGNSYHPSTISDYVANVCQQAAHGAAEHPYQVTDLSAIEDPHEGGGDDQKMQVLAKWFFTPDRAKSDGYIQTWTGQSEIGVYHYSNDAGERGYIAANESGKGKLSYVQVDKTLWPGDNSGLMIFNVSNGGQPVMCGPMAGDQWLFETQNGQEIAEGTSLHMIFTYNPGNYGAKYWRVEYLDGNDWKPAFENQKKEISGQGEIEYNIDFTSSQKIVEFTKILDSPTAEFKVRMVCCSTYQVNDKFFTSPNVKSVSRIAGDPANPAKPLPEMDMVI